MSTEDSEAPPKRKNEVTRNEALEELRLTNKLLAGIHNWITFAIVVYLLNMCLRALIFMNNGPS